MVGKAWLRSVCPLITIRYLYIIALGSVVVNNHFLLLPVALTGCEDYGASLLQHGDEVGNNDGLRILVFRGAKKFGALPAPVPSGLVIEASMAGP